MDIPVKEGETHNVSIRSVGGRGDGIAKVNGFVIFVSGTKKGDYVKIKVKKVLKNAAFAEVVEKLERPKKFETVTKEELDRMEEPEETYEDTDDFGED